MLSTLNLAVKYRAKYVFGSSSVVYGNPTEERYIFQEEDEALKMGGQVKEERNDEDEDKEATRACAIYRFFDFSLVDSFFSEYRCMPWLGLLCMHRNDLVLGVRFVTVPTSCLFFAFSNMVHFKQRSTPVCFPPCIPSSSTFATPLCSDTRRV
jgi:hypothetical protein